jgi:hypothetical protein
MAAKRTQARAPKTETLLNAVARTVGSTLGTIVAKTESVIEKPGEVLEGLKARATEAVTRPPVTKPRRAVTPPRKARPARKKAAAKKRASVKAKGRKTSR